MIKLKLPIDCQNYSAIIDACYQPMRESNPLKQKIIENKNGLISISTSYIRWAETNNLFKYKYCKIPDDEYLIMPNSSTVNLLTNNDMIKIYEEHFRDNRRGGFYEKIINSAKNPKIQCPFCCGIGEPEELDHFLPKSNLGYYSIYPYNLIPICKTCNQTWKKTFFPEEKNEQLIHPYLDNDCIFNEQWLFAEITIDNSDISLSTVKFYVNPPNHWSEDLKGKVRFHFEKFELDKRFSTRVGIDLGELIDEVIYAKSNNTNPQDFISARLAIHKESYPANHWKKALYQAFELQIRDIWNCS